MMGFNKILMIFILSGSIFFFFSCDGEITFEGENVNFYGGEGRNNSYEKFGDFYRLTHFVEDYDSSNAGGAIAPLLVLSNYQIIFPGSNAILLIENRIVKWKFKLDSNAVPASAPVADKFQNIYIIDNFGMLYSISISGKLRWKKNVLSVKEKIFLKNGDEYKSGTNHNFSASVKNHILNKNINTPKAEESKYIQNRNEHESQIPVFSDLLIVDDGIVIGTSNGLLVKFSYNGKVKWVNNFGISTTKYFPANNNGDIAFPLTHNIFGKSDTLLFINRKGNILWKKHYQNTRIVKPPVIWNDKIYLCCLKSSGDLRLPIVYCINSKGKELWKKQLSLLPRFVSVDENGNSYIAAFEGGLGKPVSQLISLDSLGKVRWDKYFEAAIPAPALIAENGLAFVATDDQAYGVYFISKLGRLEKVISLSDAPLINLLPAVTPGSNIIFGGSEKTLIVRIDDTPMNKFLPW